MAKPRLTASVLRGLSHAIKTCPLTWTHVTRQHGQSTILTDVTRAQDWILAMNAYRESRSQPDPPPDAPNK